ncbi:hypothetical protein GGTG_14160 [Gaeumannomyces tritici R3-111a-1]|uniref:Uncharacterized protein n=1 Tax=Gaeumannomyces tritici (strain R3-111a-1) TaxID=644352 RepID=J3PKU2_GAET3|nr:hypothetical protein GGTG_14160 [Gaeumannomyces tritici R3-111a-1]EJT68257.1 hypothetical protein GGTG_14160 [Gaeumannomyces tritici R3-111a-1]
MAAKTFAGSSLILGSCGIDLSVLLSLNGEPGWIHISTHSKTRKAACNEGLALLSTCGSGSRHERGKGSACRSASFGKGKAVRRSGMEEERQASVSGMEAK